jgi:hypothetical protein
MSDHGTRMNSHRTTPGTVTLLHCGAAGAAERNLVKVVEFLGGTARVLALTAEAAAGPESLRAGVAGAAGVMVSGAALAELRRGGSAAGIEGAQVLVYGLLPGERDAATLQGLTGSAVAGVELLAGTGRIRVAAGARPICRQLSGLEFEGAVAGRRFGFQMGAARPGCESLMGWGSSPMLVGWGQGESRWLLLAGEEIPDLDAPVARGTTSLQCFAGLAPVVMFLRSLPGEGFWHNPAPAACFIVDDPLLRRRYGFLDYEKLFEVMERGRFCTSIAFIPWNCKRSDPRLARRFISYPHRYSLCVHGCDHTRGEFGGADPGWLEQQARRALDRMALHRELSGVGFDDVMVFPQGIFSTAAMAALQACGYLAAVNTTPYPVDAPDRLALRDLLEPAVTRFSNFPLFTRRYPGQLAEVAWDLYLGKPGLLVEHHGYFRAGYEALASTVEQVQRFEPEVRWSNLAAACSGACWQRAGERGETWVQFFTDRFGLRNEGKEARDYHLVRRGLGDGRGLTVTVDGERVEVVREEQRVRFRVTLAPGASAAVEVRRASAAPAPAARRPERMHGAKVFLRRSLSEFRDNYVDWGRHLLRGRRAQ